MSLTGLKINRAVIYDDNGTAVKIRGFSKFSRYFNWGIRSYNIELKNATYFKIGGVFWDTYYYHYNVNDPNPLVIKKTAIPIMSSDLYNAMLETKVTREINNLAKSTLAQFLTVRNIIIGLGLLAVIVYFARGGTLAG